MIHDAGMESRITKAFEEVGDALIKVLFAAAREDWDIRQRAAESLGAAAAGVYRALCEESDPKS